MLCVYLFNFLFTVLFVVVCISFYFKFTLNTCPGESVVWASNTRNGSCFMRFGVYLFILKIRGARIVNAWLTICRSSHFIDAASGNYKFVNGTGAPEIFSAFFSVSPLCTTFLCSRINIYLL